MHKPTLVIICAIFVPIALSGCAGLIVAQPAECENETPNINIHDFFLSPNALKGSTKAEFLKEWGKPDEIISAAEDEEIWIYNKKLWCGAVPIFILPAPLLLPACDGFNRITFQGNEAKNLHTRHIVYSGFIIPGMPATTDPPCRRPLPLNSGVDSAAAKPAGQDPP